MSVAVLRQARRGHGLAVALAVLFSSFAVDGRAQTPPPPEPATGTRVGVDGFGLAGIDWPTAAKSVEATGLDKRPIEIGGGARVTNLWRALFVEVLATRWTSTGERVFVDSSGTSFPLGIPLEVSTTNVDLSVGWRFYPRAAGRGRAVIPYVAGGAGIVRYEETSPFAEPGEDIRQSKPSYHVAIGADIPVNRWLAVATAFRYRYAPNLLGDDGASGAFDENDFGGVQLSAGLRIGFGGTTTRSPRPQPPPPDETTRSPELINPPAKPNPRSAFVGVDTPIYLLPDRRRVPLRVLEAGTSITILEEIEGWFRVEFRDPQYGSRVGYVESRFVRR